MPSRSDRCSRGSRRSCWPASALWPPLSVTRIAYALALAFSVEVSFGFNRSLFPLLLRERAAVRQHPRAGSLQRARRFVARGSLGIRRGPPVQPLAERPARADGGDARRDLLRSAAEHRAGATMAASRRRSTARSRASRRRCSPSSRCRKQSKDPFSEFTFLYFSTFHWQKLVNGQSGWLPPSYLDLLDEEKDFPSDKAIAYLRQRGVEYIGVHGAFYDPKKFAEVIAALDAQKRGRARDEGAVGGQRIAVVPVV